MCVCVCVCVCVFCGRQFFFCGVVTPSWFGHLSCLITVNPADSSGCVTLLSSLSSPSSLAHKENIYPQGLLRAPARGVSMEIVSRVDGCVCVCVCVCVFKWHYE